MAQVKVLGVNLETVCGITSRLPENHFPELAFAGKSNVGKSSLINVLINRKAYARTSSAPGKTQTINYYKVDYRLGEDGASVDESIYFVDLPGYGYAKVSEETRAKWGKMIEKYLRMSKQLKAVVLLVDMRHKPSANDIQMYDWIKACGYTPVVVATKLDKVKRSEQASCRKQIREALGMTPAEKLICFSAETRQGRDEIWEEILKLKDEEKA